MSEQFLITLSDQARAGALAATRGQRITVMTRESQAVLLKDMGQACVAEGECEVETARNLQASYVVSGELVVLDGILLKLHETDRGALLATETVRAERQIDLLDGVKEATQTMIRQGFRQHAPGAGLMPGAVVPAGTVNHGSEGKISAPRTTAPSGAERVAVRFESDPPGAVVQVDGLLICQSTPCSKLLEVGEHAIAMQKERYLPATSQVRVQRGTQVRLELEPTFGWIAVETRPAGVEVSIDGKAVGKSPLNRVEVEPGLHEVVTSGSCWTRQGERVAVQRGEHRSVRIEGQPRVAFVEVHAEDSRGNALGAEVEADGSRLGVTPGIFQVPVCTSRLTVRDSTGMTYRESLHLREGSSHHVSARFDLFNRRTNAEGLAGVSGGERAVDADLKARRNDWYAQEQFAEGLGSCVRVSGVRMRAVAGGACSLPLHKGSRILSGRLHLCC